MNKKANTAAKQPAHEVVYQTLRAQILFGDLGPGQAVTIQGLCETLGFGMTPVREAIRRLIANGALTFQDNRRVSVPTLSADDLDELSFARISIECELARRAAIRVCAQDVRDLHEVDQALDSAISDGNIPGYLSGNYQFHSALYGFARAPILSDMAERLWLRFGPSLRVLCGRFGTQTFPDCHKDILVALQARDAEGAANAIEQDVHQGIEQMRMALAQPGRNI